MTYVDKLQNTRPVDMAGGRWRWNHYCHLFADSLDELHAFAARIGLKREYFQNVPGFPHYDLTQTKRALAVKEGAAQITVHEMVERARAMYPRQ